MKKKTLLFVVLSICWMTMIFTFSGRDATESTRDSNRIGYLIGEYFVPGFRQWSAKSRQSFAKRIDHPVRKCAHALEYMVLGMLLTGAMVTSPVCIKAWVLTALYSCTDEYHQLFVPGRSGQFSDILLDSTAALAGVLILYGIGQYRRHSHV